MHLRLRIKIYKALCAHICALPMPPLVCCCCRVVVGGDETGEQQPLTRLSLDTATQALRYMQEFVSEPWSTKTYSLKSWVSDAVTPNSLHTVCSVPQHHPADWLYAGKDCNVSFCHGDVVLAGDMRWMRGSQNLGLNMFCAAGVQGVRAAGGLLRRLSVELFWRGLVVAGLAGWLYSSWETSGEQHQQQCCDQLLNITMYKVQLGLHHSRTWYDSSYVLLFRL